MNLWWKKKNDVVATITFHNDSNKSYFFMKNHLPSDYVIMPGRSRVPLSSLFCGLRFNATTEDTKLYFFGSSCGYPGNLDLDEWLEIAPKKGFSFSIALNDYLDFMPNERHYNIQSSNIFIVTDEWFIEKSTNEALFSIFNQGVYRCEVKENIRYVFQEGEICKSDYLSGEPETFMQRFNFNGKNENFSFKIRTNEVSVNINGDHLHSLFDKQ